MQLVLKNAGAGFVNVVESGISISHYAAKQWNPNSSRDANRVSGGFDVGPRKGVMENSIIIKKNVCI